MCSHEYDDEVGSYCVRDCSDYLETTQKLDDIHMEFSRLIHILYGTHEIDLAVLDDVVGTICDTLEIRSPEDLPKVRRLRSHLFENALEHLKTGTI